MMTYRHANMLLWLQINNAETHDNLQDALDSDTERFIDNCGWPRFQMITVFLRRPTLFNYIIITYITDRSDRQFSL